MTRREINKIASRIKKANLVIWAAIHCAEEIYGIMDSATEEEVRKISLRLKEIDQEVLADPETYALFFQEYQEMAKKIEKYQNN